MSSELRQAWRSLQARRALTAVVVLSLAVGVGGNALLFAIVDGAVLRPFTFAEPERLVGVGAAYPKLRAPINFFEAFSGPEYAEIKRGAHALGHVSGFDLGNEPVMIGGTPERVFTAFLWDDLFQTLGVPPALGRPFSQEELRTGAPVAVISHAFWQDRLAGERSVIGMPLTVGGRSHEIVGVMPARTRIYGTDLWVPMREHAETLPRTRRQINVLARMAPNVTLAEANASLDVVARQMEHAFEASVPEYQGLRFEARRWADIEVWGGRQVATVAFAGFGLLLLLVTSNLANLVLARGTTRRGEMALRVALGAGRGTLMRQVLLESFLQAGAGGLLGCLLALVGVRVLPSWLPGFLPDDAFFGMSVRMLGFTTVLALTAAVVVGLAPAFQLARTDPTALLNGGSSRISGGRGSHRFQFVVVAFEVAVALVVAGGAALLTVNTWSILRADPGFDPRRLVMMRLTLPLPKYSGDASLIFFDRLMDAARRLPSVAHASVSNQPPPGLFSRSQFAIEGRTAGEASLPSAFFTTAGASYSETIGLRLKQGRWFDERADHGGRREVVINDAAARRYFPEEDPVGKRLRIVGPASDGAWADIVGVVADVRNRGLAADPQPEIIGSVRQIPARRQSQLYLVVRTRANAETVVADVRAIVSSIDPQQPVYAITTVEDQFNAGTAQRRLAGRVLIAFSLLALGIAGLGIYGVLSHSVGERTREIGVRLALGAPVSMVRRMVVAQAMLPVALGITAGLLTLTLGSRAVASWIFGVTPEPGALMVVSAVLAAVGLCASALPAWRASRLNPIVALRRD